MAKEKKITKHWQKLVETFFDFYEKKFDGEKPSFDGSAPRDLKSIAEVLEKRAQAANVEWTEENAITRLNLFLDAAHKVDWLRDNFLLFNLNRQKDKIFLTVKKISNGESTSSSKPTNSHNHKTAGQSVYADRFIQQLSEVGRERGKNS